MRRTVRGLALVAFALLTTGVNADDTQIAQHIASQLRTQKQAQQLKGFHIGIKVDGGHVSMKGQVSSQQQRDLALNIARRAPGVKLVINELRIAAAGTTTPTVPAAGAVMNTLRQPESAQQAMTPTTVGVSPNASTWGGAVSTSTGSASALAQPGSIAANVQATNPTLPTEARQANWTNPAAMGSGVVQKPIAQSRVPSLQVKPTPQSDALAQSQAQLRAQAQLIAAQRAQLVQFQQAQVAARQAAQRKAVQPQPTATPFANQPRKAPASRPQPRMASVPGGAGYGRTTGNVVPSGTPVPISGGTAGVPIEYAGGTSGYDQASVPGNAWPSYAAYPNYAGVTYPRQYSPTAWPYIGPFYPYPQVPLGWRKVTLEWDDGWWWLDFCAK